MVNCIDSGLRLNRTMPTLPAAAVRSEESVFAISSTPLDSQSVMLSPSVCESAASIADVDGRALASRLLPAALLDTLCKLRVHEKLLQWSLVVSDYGIDVHMQWSVDEAAEESVEDVDSQCVMFERKFRTTRRDSSTPGEEDSSREDGGTLVPQPESIKRKKTSIYQKLFHKKKATRTSSMKQKKGGPHHQDKENASAASHSDVESQLNCTIGSFVVVEDRHPRSGSVGSKRDLTVEPPGNRTPADPHLTNGYLGHSSAGIVTSGQFLSRSSSRKEQKPPNISIHSKPSPLTSESGSNLDSPMDEVFPRPVMGSHGSMPVMEKASVRSALKGTKEKSTSASRASVTIPLLANKPELEQCAKSRQSFPEAQSSRPPKAPADSNRSSSLESKSRKS